jgi:hypothetical protein
MASSDRPGDSDRRFDDAMARAWESLAAMRRASDELAVLRGRAAEKDGVQRTKRVIDHLVDDLGAGFGR